MPSSISSSLITLIFISSILLFFPTTSNASSPSTLIKKVCSLTNSSFPVKSCLKLLDSEPKVALARDFRHLTIGLVESGISKTKHARRHVRRLLRNSSTADSKFKVALKECKSSYDWSIGSFRSALREVRIREYETASYDLLLAATDCLRTCEEAVASKRIKDEVIANGNKFAMLFGLTAFEAVDWI